MERQEAQDRDELRTLKISCILLFWKQYVLIVFRIVK
jgi:hypothetical protein